MKIYQSANTIYWCSEKECYFLVYTIYILSVLIKIEVKIITQMNNKGRKNVHKILLCYFMWV